MNLHCSDECMPNVPDSRVDLAALEVSLYKDPAKLDACIGSSAPLQDPHLVSLLMFRVPPECFVVANVPIAALGQYNWHNCNPAKVLW